MFSRSVEWTNTEAIEKVFLAADYGAFLDQYEHLGRAARDEAPELVLMAAKALARRDRRDESLASLKRLSDVGTWGVSVAVQAMLQASVLEVGQGNRGEAVVWLRMAGRIVDRMDDVELRCSLDLYRALCAWAERDFGATEIAARSALRSKRTETLVLAVQFLGFVAASRGRYMEQISLLEGALDIFDREPVRDRWIEASLLQNISGIVGDLHLPAVTKRMAERAKALQWTDDLRVQEYHIARSLAYFWSLSSDPYAPFEYLDRADELAPSEAWQLVSSLDRIFFIQEMSGDRFVPNFDAVRALRLAQDRVDKIDWSAQSGEDHYGLLLFAELLVKTRPNDAEGYLRQYRRSRKAMSPLLMGRADARWTATEQFVEGTVAAANGEVERGIELIGLAFAFWNDVGYSWRAIRAALRLYELTGDERRIEWAFRESRRHAQSWLSEAVSRSGHREDPPRLSGIA